MDSHIDLDITGVAHGGVFVGRHEGRVVFVPDAVPGERVRVQLTETTKSAFWRGEVVEVLDASPHRRSHVWAAADIHVAPADRPGGADFGHIDLLHQRELKAQVLRDAMTRTGKLDVGVSMEEAHPLRDGAGSIVAEETADGTQWRTRVSLHVDEAGRIGPFARGSHRVIAVDDLPLATKEIAAAARDRSLAAPGRLDLVQSADGRVHAVLRPEPQRGQRGARRAGSRRDRGAGGASSAPSAAKGAHRSVGGSRPAVAADPSAQQVIVEQVGGREFRLDAGGFWQVHRLAAQTLTDVVTDAVAPGGISQVDPEAWHLDLYGGVGLLAAALADVGGAATKVTSVESDSRATDHAGENLAEWVGARAETARVDRWLAQLEESASPAQRSRLEAGVVILDPPRTGAGREVVQSLARLNPARIVYVACDPVALARDLATFGEAGYTTSHVRGLDLFPNSHHIEAVAVLER